jgi:hypothetical protein
MVCEAFWEGRGGGVGVVFEGSLEDGARARCDGPGHLSEGLSAGSPTTSPEVSENVSTSSRTTPPSGLPVPLDEPPHDPSKRSATTSTRSATGLPGALHTTTNPRVQRLPTGSLRDPRETPRRPPPTPSQEPSQTTSTRSPRALPRPSPRAPRDHSARSATPFPEAPATSRGSNPASPATTPRGSLRAPSTNLATTSLGALRDRSAKHPPPLCAESQRPLARPVDGAPRGPPRAARQNPSAVLHGVDDGPPRHDPDAVNDAAPPSR